MVDVYVLNTDFQIVGVIDVYESFIWTDRFYSYGDFELYTAFDSSILKICTQNYYLYIEQSKHMMIIEGVEIESDADNGNKLRITGRSIESILDRRIVWNQMTITNNTTFQNAVKYLVEDAIIDPQPYSGTRANKRRDATQLATSNDRKIPNFIFEETDDLYILGITVEKTQYTGDNLYEVLEKMFEDVNHKIGYRIFVEKRYLVTTDTTMDPNKTYYVLSGSTYVVTTDISFQQGTTYYEYKEAFIMKLYTGIDRSYSQKEYVKTDDTVKSNLKTYYKIVNNEYVVATETNFQNNVKYYEHYDIVPFVVFSPQFDNVINSNYIDNIEPMKNVTLVAGEENEQSGTRKTIIVGSGSNIQRRELFTDARDLRSEDYSSGNAYTEALKTRGKNKLVENSRATSYEGQVEANRQYIYGKDIGEGDFHMGDVIQMANEYGIEGNARVIEWVMSDSSDGFETYPTFDAVHVIDDTTIEEDNT